jgi:hypothetical protein
VTTRYRAIVVHDRERLATIAGIETARWTPALPPVPPPSTPRPGASARQRVTGYKLGALSALPGPPPGLMTRPLD